MPLAASSCPSLLSRDPSRFPLCVAGADTSLRNKDGMQPLHTAVLGCHAGTVAALLRLGADPMASCPDCYPSLAAWKMRRGVQALQARSRGGSEHACEAAA